MVELKKKSATAVVPINPSAIVSGLIGVTILQGNQPYPAQTITLTNLAVSVIHSP
jgi:hypothetical protein